ncbi:MAG: hypothetical protein ACRCVT_02950 [Leadbetterella sp.]
MTIKEKDKLFFWKIFGLTISWFTIWIFFFSPFGLLAWISILMYLILKKSNLRWYILFSSWICVPIISFLIGTIRYTNGTASLLKIGGPCFHSVDPETRMISTSSGCVFVGFEPFVFPSHNLAIKLCTRLFGYQNGTYQGVFPSEKDAIKIIETSDTVSVTYVGKQIQFYTSEQQITIDTSEFLEYSQSEYKLTKVKGKVINNECFVFEEIDTGEKNSPIYLVDSKKNKIVTSYFNY